MVKSKFFYRFPVLLLVFILSEQIAECFAIYAQENNAILAIADGVNWTYKARLVARCVVHDVLAYLNQQLFEKQRNTTKVFDNFMYVVPQDYICRIYSNE